MMRLRRPFLAAALFTSVAVVGLMPALAQTTPAPANSGAAQSEAHHHAVQRIAARPIGRRADRVSEGRTQNYTGAGDAMAAGGRGDAREREFARPGDQDRPAGPRVDGCSPASYVARAIREGARRERSASSRGVQAALREPLAGAAASGQPIGCAALRTAPPRLSPRYGGRAVGSTALPPSITARNSSRGGCGDRYGSAKPPSPKSSSQRTPRWRELDSNHRFLMTGRGPCHRDYADSCRQPVRMRE